MHTTNENDGTNGALMPNLNAIVQKVWYGPWKAEVADTILVATIVCITNKREMYNMYDGRGEQSPEFMWSLPAIHDETIKIHSVILGDGPRGKGAVFGFDNTK